MLTEKMIKEKLDDWFESGYQYKTSFLNDDTYLVVVVEEDEFSSLCISVCRIFRTLNGRIEISVDYDETIPKDNKSLLAACIIRAIQTYANYVKE